MKRASKLAVLLTFSLFVAKFLSAQTIINTSFFSETLNAVNNVDIYLPPGYNDNPDTYYPVIYFLHGWGGSENSAETIMEMAEALILDNTIDPLIIVCSNNSPQPFQGSYFINSDLNGDYEDHMTVSLINWVDNNFRTIGDRDHRSLMGQSMGGFGCFRYGVLHKDLYKGFAAHGSAINFDLAIDNFAEEMKNENNSGAPYFYDYDNGLFTKFTFSMAGAFSPNPASPQTYINPQIVEFPVDDAGELIDTIYQKFKSFDPAGYISTLEPEDSVSILFGAGRNDDFYLFEPNFAMRDTLDIYGLEYEYFDHNGTHGMPDAFKERALIFLDSIMSPTVQVEPGIEVGHWEMNEGAGSSTTDISGRSNQGTLLNGPQWTEGISGNAILFDGVDDKVDCGNSASLDMGTGDFTLTAWINPDQDQASYPTIVCKGAGASYDMGYWLTYHSNRFWLYLSNGIIRKTSYSNVISLTPYEWYHVSAVIDRDGDVTFYLNGESYGTYDISDFDGDDIVSTKSLTMGIWQSNSSTAFRGTLDRVILFNEALTQSQILEVMAGEPQGNMPPVIEGSVTANPTTVVLPETSTVSVTATDPDSDPLIYSWTTISGPADAIFTPNSGEGAFMSTASFSAAGDYLLRVSVTDGADTVSGDVQVTVLEENSGIPPKAHWPADEGNGTVAADIAGENDGDLLNGTAWTTGQYGNAIYFDGLNDKVDCGNGIALDIGTSDFSIASWVNLGSAQNTFPTILGKGAGASYDEGYWLIYRSGRVWFYVSDGTVRLQSYSDAISLQPDTWHHLAVSFDRDGLVTFYIDGSQSGTFDLSALNGIDISSSKNLSLGSWGESSFSFLQGKLDDVRLYEVTLSAQDVANIMNGDPGPGPDPDPNQGPVVDVEAFADPDTLLITETTNLSVSASDPDQDVLTYSWVMMSGPGSVIFNPNDSENSDNATASFSMTGSYSLRVYISDGIDSVYSNTNVVVEEMPAEGSEPIAHWPMDEGSGSTTEDVAGTHDGTLLAGTSWSEGISGYGINLDGRNDKVDCGTSVELDMGTGDISIAGWIKFNGSQYNDATLMAKGGSDSNDEGYWFIVNRDEMRFYISDGNNREEYFSDPVSFSNDAWYHVAAVIDRDGYITFYVDGSEAGTADVSGFDGTDISSSRELTLGSCRNEKMTYLDGVIDECRIYNSALPEDDVVALYDIYAAYKSSRHVSAANTKFRVFPNPVSRRLTVRLELDRAQNVQMNLFNMNGRHIVELCDEDIMEGVREISREFGSSSRILPGLYVLVVQLDDEVLRKRIIFQ